MENRVRQQILFDSSFTTELAIAVPSYVAVPLPVANHIKCGKEGVLDTVQALK